MMAFMKLIGVVAIVGVVVISGLFVLDIVTAAETKDILQKTLMILGIIGFGGIGISFVSRPKV